MTFLIRKIEKAKWMQNDVIGGGDISADAITNCMKTTGNKLSTWQIATESDVLEAILAIVSRHQHLDSIDIVMLNRESLEERGFTFEPSDGDTPIKDLVDQHWDITLLTYTSLGSLGKDIVEEFKKDNVKRFTKGKQKEILKDALSKGRFQQEDIDESLQKELSLTMS